MESSYDGQLNSTKVHTYVYDNEDIVLEILDTTAWGATTTTATKYVHGPGIDEPLSMERNGVVYYYRADGLGSVVALTAANQSVAESYVYSAFGEIWRNGNVGNAFTFTGREWDEETGLYYYRARYYDPEAGRFISRDPIGFGGGDVNIYNYVGGNPATWVDPSGLWQGLPGSLSGGYGSATGTIIGNILGGRIGYFAGVPIGMEIGFQIGATIGLGGGPLGSLGGGIVGGFVGGVVGGFTGGYVGGNIGGKIGVYFDSPCAGLLNCNEPIPSKCSSK